MGIVATPCAVDGKDESSLIFVELFSQLTTFPVRIMTVLCTKATKVLLESGSISARPLACKIEDLMLTTGSRGLQIERDLERLSELGLTGCVVCSTTPKPDDVVAPALSVVSL